MGKKYDAYEKAAQAERDAKATFVVEQTDETYVNAKQNEEIANALYVEMMHDPEG